MIVIWTGVGRKENGEGVGIPGGRDEDGNGRRRGGGRGVGHTQGGLLVCCQIGRQKFSIFVKHFIL